MARPLRLEGPGYWFHVTGRGNARGRIFLNDADRRRFLELLGEIEARYGLEIHCYSLMSNHYHLLVRMRNPSGLSAGLRWLGVSYTVWFNRRHRRSGHLFQGRFKAILVEFESWGSQLSRYIHLNSVRTRQHGLDKKSRTAQRAGLGKRPTPEMVNERLKALRGYTWSSYSNYVGGKTPRWLHIETVLSRFGGSRRGRNAYRRYVEEAIRSDLEESPLAEVKAGFVLGGEEFLKEVRKRIKGDAREQPGLEAIKKPLQLQDIARTVSSYKGEEWDQFVNRRGDWGRDMVLLLARKNSMMTNRELAEHIGRVDDSAVSAAVRRLEQRIQKDSRLSKTFKILQKKISAMSNVEDATP
jgi:putative transposase